MGLKKFELDRANGKMFGVCSGIANYTGVDVTLVRVGVVIVTLMGAFPWSLIAYAAAAFIARDSGAAGRDRQVRLVRNGGGSEVRDTMRDIDRRMAEVESFVTSSNSRLAQEIESLR